MMPEQPETMEEWVETTQVEETTVAAGTMEVAEIRVGTLEEIPEVGCRAA
jgi:hypothetical protein